MTILFLMDPLESIILSKDTTYVLMQECARRGHDVFFLPEGGIFVNKGIVHFHVRAISFDFDQPLPPFQAKEETILSADDVDAVFIRTDPPFDEDYLMNTWLLDRLPERVVVVNRPAGIRSANEKLWALQFSDCIPPTFVGRRLADLTAFIDECEDVVAKPTHAFGGQGIFRIRRGDVNRAVILETLTERGKRDIILQPFLPEADAGDKRILLLEGRPLGAVLRVHAGDDHRNNFMSGGKPCPTQITAEDERIVQRLAPALKANGLFFVGIDIIGRYLIEVNVTSPTCLQEINQLSGTQIERDIITALECRIENSRSERP